jgi:hypothetical protein
MIYIIILIILLGISFIETITRDRKYSNYSFLFTIILLTFFASLRNNVGTDWNSYIEFYQNGTDKVEYGYAFLNNLFSEYSIPYYIFLTFINGLSLIFFYKFLNKFSHFQNIAILLYFCDLYLYYNFSGIRQAIAIAITCYSVKFAVEKNIFTFLFFILLASLFHFTAIFFIIAYYIPRDKINKLQFIIFTSIFILGGLFIFSFSELITIYTNKNAFFYTNQQVVSDNLRSFYYIGLAKRSIVFILLIFYGKKYLNNNNFRYFLNIYTFGFFIYVTTYMISPDIGTRLSSYFTILDILLFSNLVYYVNRQHAILILSLLSIIVSYKIYGYVNDENFIYHTILDPNYLIK